MGDLPDSFVMRVPDAPAPQRKINPLYIYPLPMLGLVALLGGVFITVKSASLNIEDRTHAATLKFTDNAELTGLNSSYSADKAAFGADSANVQTDLSRLIGSAKVRKAQLLVEMQTDPAKFLQHATLDAKRDSFAVDVQPYLEKNAQVSGVISRDTAAVDLSIAGGHGKYKLMAAPGNVYSLYFVQDPVSIKEQSVVTVTGVALDNNLVVPVGGMTK